MKAKDTVTPVPDHSESVYCPHCGTELYHFSGLEHIPEFDYCPKCNDCAYDEDGQILFELD